jgi:hypothetical protein
MPRLPIIPPREDRDGGPGALTPEEADALRSLEGRTARIDRELAVSQSWLAGIERLGAADEMPDGPPLGFTRSFLEEADRERMALPKPLPSARRTELEQDLLALRDGFAGRAAEAEASGLALRRRLGLQRALESYRTGVARDPGFYDDAAGRMERLIAELDIPDDRREAIRFQVREAIGNAAVDGLMREPERVERLLTAGLFDDALSEASKAARLKEAQSLIARNRILERERALVQLAAQAEQGAASDETINAAAKAGITAAEADVIRRRNLDAAEAAGLREARVQRIASATAPLDLSDPEDKATADAYWETVSEVYASDDPAAQQRMELSLVERLRVLPDGLDRKYQGALLSDDPALVVLGAEAIDALAKLDPAMLDGMPEDRVRRGQAIAHYAALGLPPERTLELAERDLEKPTTPNSAADTPVATTNVASLEPDGRPDESEPGVSPDRADMLVELPDAISEILADEGLSGDAELTAGLTQITTAALALGLPLNDETAETLARIANGERSADAETVAPLIAAIVAVVGRVALQAGLRHLNRLWKRLQRGSSRDGKKEKDDRPQLPETPLPRPTLGTPTKEEPDGSAARRNPDEGSPAQPPSSAAKPSETGAVAGAAKAPLEHKPGPGFKRDREFVTPKEFGKLPDRGVIDPQRVRTSQDSFAPTFKEEYVEGQGKIRRTVDQLTAEVKAGKEENVPPIRLVEWKGYVYSPDHRRLVAYRRAGKDIPYVKVPIEQLDRNAKDRILNAEKLNDNGAYTIDRDGNLME